MAIPITRNTFRTRALSPYLARPATHRHGRGRRARNDTLAGSASPGPSTPPRPADASTRVEPTSRPTSRLIRRAADIDAGVMGDRREPEAGHVQLAHPRQRPDEHRGVRRHGERPAGDEVTLYVSTPARSFHVEAYRIGYYQGTGGRLVWRSTRQRGPDQPSPTRTAGTNMVEAHWSPSVRIHIGDDWPQGATCSSSSRARRPELRAAHPSR